MSLSNGEKVAGRAIEWIMAPVMIDFHRQCSRPQKMMVPFLSVLPRCCTFLFFHSLNLLIKCSSSVN